MNIKAIVIGSSFAAIVAVGVISLKLFSDSNKAVYQPNNRLNSQSFDSPDKMNEYLNMLRGNPITGYVDAETYSQVKSQVLAISKKQKKAALNMQWEQQGPDNVGGRTRAVLVDRNNPNIVYAGSVAGGLFVSQDAAATWTPVNSLSDNLAISCITQTEDGRIFFGTGSSFESGVDGTSLFSPGFPGNGIYEYVPATQTTVPVLVNGLVPAAVTGSLTFTNQIEAKGNRLYICLNNGLHYADPDGSGNYPSTIGGWTNPVILGSNPFTGSAQDVDIGTDGSVVVSFSGAVWVSPDGSEGSFVRSTFPGSTRISSAIAPSNPNFIYVLGSTSTLTNLWASTDKGNSWDVVIPGGVPSIDPFVQIDGTGGQGFYDQAIAVDPSNENRVLVGGVQFFELNLDPTTSPLAGDWVRAAVTNEFNPPFYIHADKHTMFWQDPQTIYVGGDGGVFKSTDGGATWSEQNLGYNVNTFLTLATSAEGYILGGSQDNGSQLVTFGAIGNVPSPKGGIDITSGDGNACAFSNIAGLTFASPQRGSVFRALYGGSPGTFFDTELQEIVDSEMGPFNTNFKFWESFNDPLTLDSIQVTFSEPDTIGPGDPLTYSSLTNGLPLLFEPATTTILDSSDTLILPDYLQSKFVYQATEGNIYLTLDAIRLNAIEPEWYHIANNVGGVVAMEFSPDGNHLYLGNTGGQIFRISGLSLSNEAVGLDIDSAGLVTTTTLIASGLGGVVTGIAIDPNNGENMIATVGNYNVVNHVFRSTTAQSTTTTNGFQTIQGPTSSSAEGFLPRMPVYDAAIDVNDHNVVLIGTDFGVWGTDNAFSAAAGSLVEWTNESANGMAHVPVFEVVQQHLNPGTGAGKASNSQVYYLGTHGRGFYSSDSRVIITTDINENELVNNNESVIDLKIYPNPVNNNSVLDFNISEQEAFQAKIYNLSGKLVQTINLGVLTRGDHKVRFDASSLSIGSYIVALESPTNRKVAKFIVTR